jgi:hypothetical protein
MRSWGVGLFLMALALSLANCTGQFRAYCEARFGCEPGNEKDIDACVSQLEGASDIAEAYDCGDEFDELADCITAKGACVNGNFQEPDDSCEPKSDAYKKCTSAASAKKSGIDL